MKAFRVTLMGIESVVLTHSRGAARYAAIRSAREAGYAVMFGTPITTQRVPEFDDRDVQPSKCLSQESVESAPRRTSP